jgi:hypothetical protein
LFDQAVETLTRLYTKPTAAFAATKHDPVRLRGIAEFLEKVGEAKETRK